MDIKLIILKSKLSNIVNNIAQLSKKIDDKSLELDATLNFEDISTMLTQNRRALSRAKQHAAEIAQITRSGQQSSANFGKEKSDMMYKSELMQVCINDDKNPSALQPDEPVQSIKVELKNIGISYKWEKGTIIRLECESETSINKIFSYNGEPVGYGQCLTALFNYEPSIDFSGKEKVLLNFSIEKGELKVDSHSYLIEIREA